MATLYITEFLPRSTGTFQVAVIPPVAEQTVAIGISSVASAAFNSNTGLVRLCCDSPCSVAWGLAPIASSTTCRLPANGVEYFNVSSPGMKVAVITNN